MRDFSKNQWIVFEHNGVRIVCRLTIHPTKSLPLIWCRFEHQKLLPLALEAFIRETFNIPKLLQIKIKFSELSDFPSTNEVDNLQEWWSAADPYNVETFFRVIKVKNNLSLTSDVISPHSNILSVPHLHIGLCPLLTVDHLLNFQGKSAVFQNTQQISNDNLVQFIKNWLNGRHPNLESMIVTINTCGRGLFRREMILKHFETKPWDPSKRSGRFKYLETATKLYHWMDILDCSQQVDIEKIDGLLATIIVEHESFCFFVWKNNFPDPKNNMPVVKLYTPRPVKSYIIGSVSF
ncbi:unnamed protein product [Caenorhabditis brenneri]